MRYTLITAKGKIRKFFVLDLAELYRSFEGGFIRMEIA